MTWKEQEALIEQNIAQAREAIQERVQEVQEYAWRMDSLAENYPYTYGRHHPVWGEDIRADIRAERAIGAETGPPMQAEVDQRYATMERWEQEVAWDQDNKRNVEALMRDLER